MWLISVATIDWSVTKKRRFPGHTTSSWRFVGAPTWVGHNSFHYKFQYIFHLFSFHWNSHSESFYFLQSSGDLTRNWLIIIGQTLNRRPYPPFPLNGPVFCPLYPIKSPRDVILFFTGKPSVKRTLTFKHRKELAEEGHHHDTCNLEWNGK